MFERDGCDPLIPILAKEVAAKLSKIARDVTISRLKIWYYDTHAPCCYFLGDVLTERGRAKCLAESGRNALYEIWDRVGSIEFGIGEDDDSPSIPMLAKVYEMMCSDQDKDEQSSRILAQKLSWRLNETDWLQHGSVTDDFIVYAQNGTDSGCDTYEDLIESVPTQKIQMLRQRDLVGPGASYTNMKRFASPARWAEIVEYGEKYRHPKDCGTS